MTNEPVDPARALSGQSERRALEGAFAPWRAQVNGHLIARRALDGLTIGACFGAVSAAASVLTHHHGGRLIGLAFSAAGAIGGAIVGARAVWSDRRVALFVDGVLGQPETITSAIELEGGAPPAVVLAATDALQSSKPRAPHRLHRRHTLGAFAVVACLAIVAVRAPKPIVEIVTGTDVLKRADVAGLDKVAQVEKLPARDAAQKERLRQIAEDARALKEKLREGMPRRDALDRLHKLRDKLDAERKELGGGERQGGLDAAADALKDGGFPGLSDALEDRDLQSFDEMMERIANAREAEDYEKAHDALEKAIEDAKRKGADDAAKALEKEKERLERRKDKADALRELADALKGTPGDPGSSARRFDGESTDKAGRDLADSLRKGLEKLTPEERKKLADRLKKESEGDGDPSGGGKSSKGSKKKRKELADKLRTPEGQKELEKQLKDFADGKGEDDESDAEKLLKGLRSGEDGTDDATGELGDGGDGGDGGKPGSGKPGTGKPKGGG
ncbi:MAG: hypothetical protein ACHREM_33755, partial [Polyangiales bacterium]